MKHLTTSASAQTLKIIPRSYASTVSMILRDDSTNTSTTYGSISTSTDKNYLVISKALSPVLVEGRFYDMTVKEGASVIYKDKILSVKLCNIIFRDIVEQCIKLCYTIIQHAQFECLTSC